MAITFDQFKIVILDRAARQTLGLSMSDDDAAALHANEAGSIAFFETWQQGPPISAASFAAELVRWDGLAVAGFVLSLVGVLFPFVQFRPFVLLVLLVGLVMSANSIGATKKNGRRGRGLAIAGVLIASFGFLGVIAIGVLSAVH